MRCLVIGSGGREHALVRALLDSPEVSTVWAAPGNPGIAAERGARCVALAVDDLEGLLAFARAEAIDLTVVGPEAPLVAGVVDRFRSAGLRILGPSAAAAQIEGSKAFAKMIMDEAGVPTGRWGVYSTLASARAALPDGPSVIKHDGLAGGKGVYVVPDRAAAEHALETLFAGKAPSDQGQRVLVEEHLTGPEVSVIALCDGERYVLFPPAQDHKRVGEGDRGPNTGGMGAYAPAPDLPPDAQQVMGEAVIGPILDALARRGTPFTGFLYAGIMLTPSGPRVLEYNARLGDPEAQVLLALAEGGVAQAFASAADGALEANALRFREGATACVVLAAEGYPAAPRIGDAIAGLADAAQTPGVSIFHGATRRAERGAGQGSIETAGGRVLAVTASADALDEALRRCYRAIEHLSWPGLHYRRDIGWRALARADEPPDAT